MECGSVILIGQIRPDITCSCKEVVCDQPEEHPAPHHGVFNNHDLTWSLRPSDGWL